VHSGVVATRHGTAPYTTAEAAIVASLESPPFDEGGSVVDIIEN